MATSAAAAAQALVLAAVLAVLVGLYLWFFAGEATADGRSPDRDRLERGDARRDPVFGVLRSLVIVGLLLVTLFPFYYMVLLSLRPLDQVLRTRARCWPTRRSTSAATPRCSRRPRPAARAS